MKLHPDFRDFLDSLDKNKVDFLVVGAFALAFHGHPRATGDLDIWIRPEPDNAGKLLNALRDFGFGQIKITEEDIVSGKIIQLGFPPVRIDLITLLDGLTTDEIWEGRVPGSLGTFMVNFLGRDQFIINKRAIGRHKDLADLELLLGD